MHAYLSPQKKRKNKKKKKKKKGSLTTKKNLSNSFERYYLKSQIFSKEQQFT